MRLPRGLTCPIDERALGQRARKRQHTEHVQPGESGDRFRGQQRKDAPRCATVLLVTAELAL